MVSFSSYPNVDFIAEIVDKFVETSVVRYMPNWRFKKQQFARDILGLEISDRKLRSFWSYFGGTVRRTFSARHEDRINGAQRIKRAIKTINAVSRVKAYFQGESDDMKTILRLFHFDISCEDDTSGLLKPASRHIASLIAMQIGANLSREKPMIFINGVGRGSGLLGWMFEILAHKNA